MEPTPRALLAVGGRLPQRLSRLQLLGVQPGGEVLTSCGFK